MAQLRENRLGDRLVTKAVAPVLCATVVIGIAGVSVRAERDAGRANRMCSVPTEFNDGPAHPEVAASAFVHPSASLIGDVAVGKRVMVSPGASLRGDEGAPVYVADFCNVQDCAVIRALPTCCDGEQIGHHMVSVAGTRYAVYIDVRVSIASQAQIHGPALVGHDTFVGMQSLVFNARIGGGCVIEPGAKVFGREGMITVPDGRYVPACTIVTTQEEADALPVIGEGYAYAGINRCAVESNVQLAGGYVQTLLSQR